MKSLQECTCFSVSSTIKSTDSIAQNRYDIFLENSFFFFFLNSQKSKIAEKIAKEKWQENEKAPIASRRGGKDRLDLDDLEL